MKEKEIMNLKEQEKKKGEITQLLYVLDENQKRFALSWDRQMDSYKDNSLSADMLSQNEITKLK